LYITRATARIDSVAVLPFTTNAVTSDGEVLADDVTAGLIDSLSHLPSLKVMSRSSVSRYKDREIDPRIVGRELSVRSILTGTIVQNGDTLIVTAELVNANDGSHLWGREFRETTSDVLEMQAELSRAVSEGLDPKLSRAAVSELSHTGTANREAYSLYVKARYFADRWDSDDWKRALASFQQAIEKDPRYAQAYAGTAEAYAALTFDALVPWQEGIKKAKTAAHKALELRPNLADGYCGLAIASYVNREWEESEQLARQCVQLNPNFVPGHQYHAWTLESLGRMNEGLTEENLALALNPASVTVNHFLADAYFYSRDYDSAIEQQLQALQLSPDDADLHDSLATSYLMRGKYDQAAQEYQRSLFLHGEPDRARGLERSYTEGGITAVLKAMIEFHNDPKRHDRYDPDYVAKTYAMLHDRENALLWLERAYKDREIAGGGMLMDVLVTPELDYVRSDPRYKTLLDRLGFPPSAISAL
jgi:TolB-like protein/Tfp pilus assembly protein PilF